MVSKLATSRYRSGRSKTWIKCKCFTESSFVIIVTDRYRKTMALMALLARREDQGLSYVGSAFIALPGSERDELLTLLESVRVNRSPIPRLRLASAQWVKPEIKARVRYLAGTKSLRHGTLRGFN